MEKRLFLAFSITLVFFIVYSHLVAKFIPQPTPAQEDSKINLMQEGLQDLPPEISQSTPALTPEDKEESVELPGISVGNFVIKYSSLGGYIKKVFVGGVEHELPFQNIGFLPGDREKQFVPNFKSQGIEFVGPEGQKKEFIFKDYTLEIKIDPPPGTPLVLFSNYLSPNVLDQRYQEIFYSQNGGLERISPRKIKAHTYNNVEFAGARERYYCLSLFKGNYDLKWVSKDKERAHLYLSSPGEQVLLYLGPQVGKEMEPFGLQGVIDYGFFHGIAMVMIKLLYLFYGLIKNWGWSIVLFSASVSLILFPFTSKSSKAMRRMQQVQPEVEAIKAKYKDNPQKLQKETIELYRKHKINPLGGCLPLLFQIPVIMAFYQIVYRFIELRGASFLWIKDLSGPDHFLKLPLPAPLNYLNLLPILLMVMGILQQKITASSAASQQKAMGLFFAVFIGVIFYGFPAALTLYWLIQNIFTLSYQTRLSKGQA